MALRAIALRRCAVVRKHGRDLRAAAVALEDLLQQGAQFIEWDMDLGGLGGDGLILHG